MIKLARIYYNDELINHENLDYVEYIKGDSNIDLNCPIPTLIVGWLLLKKYIDQPSILDNNIISNKLYWAYSFNEDKHGHISKVSDFVQQIPNYYFNSKYTYINLDPVFFGIESIDELMNFLPKTDDSDSLTIKKVYTYIYKNDMIYILFENKITGIDLKIYEYFNFNIEKIKTDLIKRSYQYFDDIDGSIYQSYYRILPNFDNLKRYILVLLTNK